MLCHKKIVAIMPAYNAESTILKTFQEIDRSVIDEIVVVDDGSQDRTVEVCRNIGLFCVRHERNLGYGANQEQCYQQALKKGADIVVMIHPDYQYDPKIAPALAGLVASGVYDVVLASRILGKGALAGGMPLYKYAANRGLTFVQNLLCGQKLSEYHTGYRAFSRAVLEKLPLYRNSDDFIFDNEILAQAIVGGYRIGEVSCPTRYADDSSSIDFFRSVHYGMGVLAVSIKVFLQRLGWMRFKLFENCR